MAAKARKAIIAEGIKNPEILSIERNVKIAYDILGKYRVEENDTDAATSEPVNTAE